MPVTALIHLLDPLPILGVAIGALVVAGAQSGRDTIGSAFSALAVAFMADPESDRNFARAAVNAADRIAEVDGLPHTDRVKARPGFLSEALHRIADGRPADRFALWAEQAIADRAGRHARVIGFWDAVADAAPAMGMAGTIIGLISMFARMDDAAAVGPAMAMALLATFHGLVIANILAGPLARRLERQSAEEIAWQRALVDRLCVIARREEALIPALPSAGGHPPRRPHAGREAA